MAENINQAVTGLNLDTTITQLPVGSLTYALNANIANADGNEITYQNDQANIECIVFPEGYKVIGVKNITQINKVIYFLANPSTGFSQIGYTDNNSCTYTALIDDSVSPTGLLNFSVDHPIHKVEVKTTNCSTQFYWTDKFNPRRFIDLNKLPWVEVLVGTVLTPVVGSLDVNKMLVQPHFSTPKIEATELNIGGNLIEGDYQFAIQYSDILGNGYTSFYSVSNPVRIFLDGKISPNFNEVTSKSISLDISLLDTTGLYDYFNLAVIKTINKITTVELVTTQRIQRSTAQYTYTGTEASNANIKLSISDIFEKINYYDLAGDLTQVDNVLVWADLVKEDDKNYQKIWNQVVVGWEAYQVPDNRSVGYRNGVTCANIQGYMRDEVYPLEGCFILKNGKQTTRGHIPGRIATAFDRDLIPYSNADVQGTSINLCSGPTENTERWKVYNTGSLTGYHTIADDCEPAPYAYGEMGYWESDLKYPNNPDIWGPLADQPMRHHKFPDSTIIHIHDNNQHLLGTDQYNNYQHFVYPIGFKVDINSLRNAIQSSPDLSQEEKDNIVGFKIMHGDRVNHKSVVAKGLLYNCGKYTKETNVNTGDKSTYYYPNYPFNDVNPDPFISSLPVAKHSGANVNTRLSDFQRGRFTFHSPDTSFFQPSGIDGSFLKLETAEYGNCKSHFVPVKDNAGVKLRTLKTLQIALAGAITSIMGIEGHFSTTIGSSAGVTTGVSPSIHAENFFPTFNNVLEIIDKLIPYTNYGWQYDGVGFYGNYLPIPNNGNKIRSIENGGYLTSGLQGTFGDDLPINNINRESSVYLHVDDDLLPYPFENVLVPADNSRVIASDIGLCNSSANFYRNISSYYGSIKRYLPSQWGEIFSYTPVDTGFYSTFVDTAGNTITSIPTVFGGDIFINRFALKRKHSFFLKSTVNKEDGTDIDYDKQGNVGYPIWYYSTSDDVYSVNNSAINSATTTFINVLDNWILNLIAGGIPTLIAGLALIITLIKQGVLRSLGLKVTNLDCFSEDGLYETGEAYLYAYGVPFFYAESEVNVDMRQATNLREGNFYPQVSSDIPDDWLQETNVPIIWDNIYVYNDTYSKQNKETFFATLRPDWSEDEPCFTYFPNTAIWSDQSNLEETKNNWLIYRPNNTFNFPKSYGKLTGIDKVTDRGVLVRYENKAQLYNATVTIATTGIAASLGTGTLFSGTPPIDLSETDTGFGGSQNKFFIKTEQGNVYTDAKRGQVLLMKGTSVTDLTERGVEKWFSNNLPFKILNVHPDVPIDNNFNGIGLHGVYDNFYKRLILTKIDYEPLNDNIKFDGTNFYIDGETIEGRDEDVPGLLNCCPDGYTDYGYPEFPCRKYEDDQEFFYNYIQCPPSELHTPSYTPKTIISLNDPEYFCNKSWTISYSFKTNTWVSLHSFRPNYYIPYENYFQSGINTEGSLWDHNVDFDNFNAYYGVTYPYILEYPFNYKILDEILQNVKDYTTVLKYQGQNTWTEPKEQIFFNKSIIYNGQQCSGVRNLFAKSNTSLKDYGTYPKYNTDSIDILYTKADNFYNYNQFWDVVIDPSINIWNDVCEYNLTNKELNTSNLDYGLRSFRKNQIRGKNTLIRHILDDRNDVKLLSRFILAPSVNSYR